MRKLYLKKYVLLSTFLMLSVWSFAQTGSISGKVLDEKNLSLPGASVTVDGTTLGATTDIDGNFRITGVKPGTYGVTANFVGYNAIKKTITVSSGNVQVNFQMQPTAQSLNEVVVIGYGTQTRKEVTGAISTVSARDFQQGATTSPGELIQGKVSGVSVTTNSGQPGAGTTIRIRQGASLNASNDPLIVIDGVPLAPNRNPDGTSTISGVADPLSLINPNDIETFTVLKDAASTAIYGSRASNGVILITTKKGTAGKPVINFSTKNSLSTKEGELSVLSADEIRTYVKAYDAANGTNRTAMLGTANTNWQNAIYQTALTSDNNLSISGTTKNIPYRVSVGYLDETGILKTDHLQRPTVAIRLSPKLLHDDLKLDFNVNGTYAKSRFANQGAIGASASFDPTQPIYVAGSPWNGYYEWYNTPGVASTGINPNASRNPVGVLEDYHSNGDTYRSFGNFTADYRFPFLKALRANLNLGYDASKGGGSTFIPANAAQSYSTLGSSSEYHQNIINTTGEFYLNYNSDIKALNSNINATAGYGYYDFLTTTFNYPTYSANGTLIAGSTPTYPFDKPRSTLISYYSRLIYTFNTKYIFAGSLRTDGSSKFSPDNRWGVFPSAAFTWRMSDENFLKDAKALSDLKLRLSYGVTGQQAGIGNYGYLPTYYNSVTASQYQFGNTFYNMYAPSAYNSTLKWETTEAYNAGFDFGFFNQRISGAIDAYYKKTRDLLSSIPVPAGTNFSNILTYNVGNMKNSGVEFSIRAIAAKTKDITWNINYNIAYNYNEITNLSATKGTSVGNVANTTYPISGATGTYIEYNTVGYSPNAFLVYKQVYDANGKPLQGVFQDLNGDGVINSADLYHYKNPYPKVLMGFSTDVSYKKWTVSTVLRASLGNYIYNNTAANLGTQNTIISTAGLINNGSSDIYNTGFTNSQYLSDYYVQNASFLRMDNAGLAYNFGNIFHNNRLNLRLNANVQNVFVITKYQGLDPEVYNGIDNNFYQRPRTYTLGLNLGF
ncbi:SusC/RagA family TonB-linked outer membrane protein [Mucilaginibacter arboris]|uniref:SusC/RagA family TonB-linked outer membrane protein n=1 Tax=Mucilaginibacter arboris TaxID=2682090 RepID=A0A7K1SVP3_9SPHI|nr:SusC/RagA family TonB-linked outer membrane protein [Mucilaginibacter arboris]MVN21401.1 SusC/RagA family TonB-linked outer membrane protein [Mucilaginibacter arboris]